MLTSHVQGHGSRWRNQARPGATRRPPPSANTHTTPQKPHMRGRPHLARHGCQVPDALLQVDAALQQRAAVARDDGRELLERRLGLLLTVQLPCVWRDGVRRGAAQSGVWVFAGGVLGRGVCVCVFKACVSGFTAPVCRRSKLRAVACAAANCTPPPSAPPSAAPRACSPSAGCHSS